MEKETKGQPRGRERDKPLQNELITRKPSNLEELLRGNNINLVLL